MPSTKLSTGKYVCCVIFCTLLFSIIYSAQTPAVDDPYQNQQRAIRLLAFDDEIKTLPDVEIRCQLRFTILQFIYKNEVKSEYPNAEQLLATFFVEMTTNEKLLSPYRIRNWGNSMALLLRNHSPDMAKRIEAKYVHDVDTSEKDFDDLMDGRGNKQEIVNRAIARVAADNDAFRTINLFNSVKRTDKEAAQRIFQAVLDSAEKHPEAPRSAYTMYTMLDASLNPPAFTVEPEKMLRYYRCLVASSRIALATSNRQNYSITIDPLRRILPKIKEADKVIYSDGSAVIAKYLETLSKEELRKDSAMERVKTSDDQIEQALTEAEAAPNPQQRDLFLGWAATLAVAKKDYHHAVDLMLKTAPDLGIASRPKGRDEDMINRIVRPAYRNKDYDDAYYAIGHIKDDLIRAKIMMEAGWERGRMNIKGRDEAASYVINALDLLEMTAPDFESISRMGNTRSLLTMLGSKPAMTLDDFTARAVRAINRIPATGADAKPGTPERADYVTKILSPTLSSIDYIFHPVWDSSPCPDPKLADEIKVKEWRLAAKIAAESFRRYPLAR